MSNQEELNLISNSNTNDIVTEVNKSLTIHENKFLEYVKSLGLPSENILVSISERKKIIKNFEDVIEKLKKEDMRDLIYISKFLAAATSGLFDAALNYLWNETVFQLRKRVSNYDIEYFYDVAVTYSDKRKRLSGVEDLPKLDDSELIKGSKEIEMISEIGFRHLDYIKYMRNWASAAHPNQVQLTGMQLMSWLETCINEVINLPNSHITVETGRLLKNLKEQPLNQNEINMLSTFICNLSQDRVNTLANGLFGIYTRSESENFVRENVRSVVKVLWDRIDEATKNDFGIKYARFTVNGDVRESNYAKELLEHVKGESYFPEPMRITELDTALNQLYQAHNNINNFYTEPALALHLERLVGKNPVPRQLYNKYVNIIVDSYITNGNGVCYDADAVYHKLISLFDQDQIIIALFTVMDEHISSMLQLKLCSEKYMEMIELLKVKNVTPAILEIINLIEKSSDISTMRKDSVVKQKMETYKVLLKKEI